jgi:hypothetical protein
MGDVVAEEDRAKGAQGRPAAGASGTSGPAPAPLRIERLLLLDSAGNDPVPIDALVIDDEGIGVVRSRGGRPQVLPWPSVSAHVVERWAGGAIPEWWVDPELNRSDQSSQGDRGDQGDQGAGPAPTVVDPRSNVRALPRTEPGVVISVQGPFGTYRFLARGGDPDTLSRRITDFAVRHQGLSGVPPVTTVARPRRAGDRRQGTRVANRRSGWSRVQPYLAVALVVLIAVAVTLILLQSAGTIHLPYLGGSGPGASGPFRTR